ncbi:hypothetical protein [Leadbettera azotonutricia]|uniref:Uncharacterized protein n=1 Tax=Leadbettera azotonutricia (strain ATCC BAA-888 / DSM 13862 / ZAS-9) TaxID=545695 RepID=F5Y999_LEAAZ|nr:hypothetical protein [Leadbettera azotonutricia]AEF80797.1 hypothetical protein TREAZ_2162 [Leadbettera azotonutricia ZAS-9]
MAIKYENKVLFIIVCLLLAVMNSSFGQETQSFEGEWTNITSTMLAYQFFLNDNGEISATMLVFSGNKCAIKSMQGILGFGTQTTWEGTFKVNIGNKTIDLIDDFGDADRYRYVFSEDEENFILKLKDSDGDITTWYKRKS